MLLILCLASLWLVCHRKNLLHMDAFFFCFHFAIQLCLFSPHLLADLSWKPLVQSFVSSLPRNCSCRVSLAGQGKVFLVNYPSSISVCKRFCCHHEGSICSLSFVQAAPFPKNCQRGNYPIQKTQWDIAKSRKHIIKRKNTFRSSNTYHFFRAHCQYVWCQWCCTSSVIGVILHLCWFRSRYLNQISFADNITRRSLAVW